MAQYTVSHAPSAVTITAPRQVVLSAFGAVAAGLGYVRYLEHNTDPLVWSVVAVYTAVCLSAAIIGACSVSRRG